MATASKKSISFFPEDIERIKSFPSQIYGNNFSGKVQEMVQDLHYALIRTRKEIDGMFSESDWMYLRDMINGSLVTAGLSYKSYITIRVGDSDTYDGLGTKWKVDVPALLSKIDLLTEFQAYTVVKEVHTWLQKQKIEN